MSKQKKLYCLIHAVDNPTVWNRSTEVISVYSNEDYAGEVCTEVNKRLIHAGRNEQESCHIIELPLSKGKLSAKKESKDVFKVLWIGENYE